MFNSFFCTLLNFAFCNEYIVFLARKELGTPIYHRYKHKHTQAHRNTYVRVCVFMVCVSVNKHWRFGSKDHNLAIEKDYEF